MTVAYAELHALSNFTFLRGASHPEELVEQADALWKAVLTAVTVETDTWPELGEGVDVVGLVAGEGFVFPGTPDKDPAGGI
jgi:hypothetical protein